MRRTARILLTVAIAVTSLALPAVPGIGAPPGATAREHAVATWDRHGAVSSNLGAGGGDELAPVWLSGPVAAGDAVVVAAELPASVASLDVRARSGAGDWGRWQPLEPAGEHVPDPGSAEAAQVVAGLSEPVWVGRSDQLQLRASGATDPGTVRLLTVDVSGGDGLAWRPPRPGAPGAAEAVSVWPPMVPRSSWDPHGECQPRNEPDYAPAVERAYVHHTAIFPHYTPEEADDLVRAICVFHTEQRGFSDIGYNFLIDQYGTIYQGRAGGILRPVVGAHASGFNHESVGIALIGNFDEHGVPPAALGALDELLAWLFEWHGVDPYAVTPHVSTGGATTPHPEGEVLLLPTIVGHRQTATNTSCPGEQLFAHVTGADPASHRVAARLAERGVDVGEPIPVPPPPRVVPPDAQAAPTSAATDPDAEAAMGRVIEGVVAAFQAFGSGRLVPALGLRPPMP